jgi:hypothetical protein
MSAKVRYPYLRIWSAVIMVIEAGASVTFWENLEAPETVWTSTFMRSARSRVVKSCGVFFSSAWAGIPHRNKARARRQLVLCRLCRPQRRPRKFNRIIGLRLACVFHPSQRPESSGVSSRQGVGAQRSRHTPGTHSTASMPRTESSAVTLPDLSKKQGLLHESRGMGLESYVQATPVRSLPPTYAPAETSQPVLFVHLRFGALFEPSLTRARPRGDAAPRMR